MTNPPERFKKVEELSVAEHIERQALRAGASEPRFETEEYKTYRNRVLEAGGLEPDREVGWTRPRM